MTSGTWPKSSSGTWSGRYLSGLREFLGTSNSSCNDLTAWGFYAYLKKSLPIGPNQGFALEVALLTPFALAYVSYLTATGTGHFLQDVPWDTALLLGTGVVTAVPLMLYANGAKGLRLSTIAMMQYIAPTMIFLTAVFIFGEPFGQARAIAFPMIWAALALYTASMLRARKQSLRAGRSG